MKKTIIALALGSLVLGSAAYAEGPVNLRQANQERRIDAGKRSGKLTHAEYARLKAEQHAIWRLEQSLKARHGGHLTRHDKALIAARQNAADRHILGQKHDAQRGKNHLKL